LDRVTATRDATVGMFVYNNAQHDARVWREATALARDGYRVTVFALASGDLPGVDERGGVDLIRVHAGSAALPGSAREYAAVRIGLAKLRWLAKYIFTWQRWRRRAARRAGRLANAGSQLIWHGHDLTGLAAAALAQRFFGGLLVYDAHELFVETHTIAGLPAVFRRAITAYERRLIRRTNAVITVNELVAAELVSRYGVSPATVIMNCPPLGDEPGNRLASPLRSSLGLAARPVALYHGAITRGRVSAALDAMMHIGSDVALVLLGDGVEAAWLRRWSDLPEFKDRLYLHPAIPVEVLRAWISGADVGVMVLQPTNLNHYLSTPNKLFECMNAGVPVVASDFPGMRDIIQSQDIGKVCDPKDPRSVASAIRNLLDEPPDVHRRRSERCRRAAEERYSWERESQKLVGLYRGLVARAATPVAG